MSSEEISQVNQETSSSTEESEDERLKKLGNDAFAAKNYSEAIDYYSKAIVLNPENAIYYSNRSACYAFQSKWDLALEDAKSSLSKDPKFLKGYYRLVTAQIELGNYNDAEITINAALKLDPNNEPILKQMRLLKAKQSKTSEPGDGNKPRKQLDESQVKEIMEIQDMMFSYNKDLRSVHNKLAAVQRNMRVQEVTANYLKDIPTTAPLYRALGKAYISTPRDEIDDRLAKESEINAKSQRDLVDRKEYLERRIASANQHLKDIASGF